jgi:hypothetical protein
MTIPTLQSRLSCFWSRWGSPSSDRDAADCARCWVLRCCRRRHRPGPDGRAAWRLLKPGAQGSNDYPRVPFDRIVRSAISRSFRAISIGTPLSTSFAAFWYRSVGLASRTQKDQHEVLLEHFPLVRGDSSRSEGVARPTATSMTTQVDAAESRAMTRPHGIRSPCSEPMLGIACRSRSQISKHSAWKYMARHARASTAGSWCKT